MRALLFLVLLCTAGSYAQNREWHVKPRTTVAGNSDTVGDGSYDNPWSIQNAFNNPDILPAIDVIHTGDTVWLHGGTYDGRFFCGLNGVSISSYPGEWAVINGNVTPTVATLNVLNVTGNNSIYKDFEVTCIGTYGRLKVVDHNGNFCSGLVNSLGGINQDYFKNSFINLVVRQIPGTGIGSWKQTLDSEIYGCIVYNNGYVRKILESNCASANPKYEGKGFGIYTQNESGSNKRLFKNNIFMNNYDSGIAVWSADTLPVSTDNFLRNYRISQNIFLNNGGPVRDATSNVKIMSGTKNAYNRPRDIEFDKNILYFNSTSDNVSGLYVEQSDNVNIHDNYIFKGTSGSTFKATNTNLKFKGNFYWGKHIQYDITKADYLANSWDFQNNTYHKVDFSSGANMCEILITAPSTRTRISLAEFKGLPTPTSFSYMGESTSTFNAPNGYSLLTSSAVGHTLYFNGNQITPFRNKVFITQNKYNKNLFYVVIFDAQTDITWNNGSYTIDADFTPFGVPSGKYFKVRDAERYFPSSVPLTGTLAVNKKISLPMYWTDFELPTGTAGTDYILTGVDPAHTSRDLHAYIIEFGCEMDYDKSITRTDNGPTLINERAKSNIFFRSTTSPAAEYVANATANVDARAGKQILLTGKVHIKSTANFLARIENTCPDLDWDPVIQDDQVIQMHNLSRFSTKSDQNTRNTENFAISPNPSNGIFSIRSLNELTISRVEIRRIDNSKLILNKELKKVTSVDVDIAKETAGLFTLQVTFENGETQAKTIIKQ